MCTNALRAAALAAAVSVAASACGSGDHHDDGDDRHDDEDVAVSEWPAGIELPTVDLRADASRGGTVDVVIDIDGFEIVPDGGDADIAGAGHFHVYVDGTEIAMSFRPRIHLTDVDPGPHTLMVELAAVDHSTLAVDGAPLRYTTEFVMPGDPRVADTIIEVAVDESGAVGGVVEASASVGDVVEIVVVSAIDEELHVHAYDVMGDLVAGERTIIRFDADIPGVFDVELEGSGRLVISLEVS